MVIMTEFIKTERQEENETDVIQESSYESERADSNENLTQTTHWRIKTHLAISHHDFAFIQDEKL